MKPIYHTVVKPVLLAALVAGACDAMAAQRFDLASVNLNARGLAPQSILTLTGLSNTELEFQFAEKVNGQNVARFQQFYRGIPVLGQAVVAKVSGDPKHATPTALSGVILRNLDQDLPSIKPGISEKTALEHAKTLSRTQNTSAEKVNLYIQQGPNGAARLVYIVSFKNDSAAAASRPSYLIDATNGAVLDSWEGVETARKFGPGDTYKKAFDALTQMPGWNLAKASQVIGLARDVYWTEGSKLNQGACGAAKAAADLGFKVADVSAAFNIAGSCHGNVEVAALAAPVPIDATNAVFGNMFQVDDHQSDAASGARLTQRAISSGTLSASTGWQWLNNNVQNLGSHGTYDFAKYRFQQVLGQATGKSPPLPASVCFGTGYYVYGSTTTWNACAKVMSASDQAQFRYVGTGTYTKDTAYTPWYTVPDVKAVERRNYLNTAQLIGGDTLYTSATAISKNWSVATSAGVKITEKLSVPLVEETSIEVSLGITSTVGGSITQTYTTNLVAPKISVPAGKAVRYELVQKWQPITTVWSVPVQFSGYVGSDYNGGWSDGVHNWHTWAVPAANYFYEYTSGSEKARITVNQRKLQTFTILATIIP